MYIYILFYFHAYQYLLEHFVNVELRDLKNMRLGYLGYMMSTVLDHKS